MKKICKISLIIVILLCLYSLGPLIPFYMNNTQSRISLNQDVAKKVTDNKDPYFAFIVTSDTGSGIPMDDSATLKIARTMNREMRFNKIPIDFVVNVGDVTYRGKESHYKNYLKIKETIKFPVISAIGNHDDDIDNGEKGLALFNKYCGLKEFSFADRNSYFIVLDDINGNFKEEQFAHLEEELKKAKNYKHTFIFMHKPPFNPLQGSWYRVETNPWSHRFLKLCDEYKVDIVFSGHEHGTRVARFGSVIYIISGGGGSMLDQPSYEGGFLNYVFVKVNRDYVDYEVRRVPPPVWEFFVYYLWKDLVFFIRDMLI